MSTPLAKFLLFSRSRRGVAEGEARKAACAQNCPWRASTLQRAREACTGCARASRGVHTCSATPTARERTSSTSPRWPASTCRWPLSAMTRSRLQQRVAPTATARSALRSSKLQLRAAIWARSGTGRLKWRRRGVFSTAGGQEQPPRLQRAVRRLLGWFDRARNRKASAICIPRVGWGPRRAFWRGALESSCT